MSGCGMLPHTCMPVQEELEKNASTFVPVNPQTCVQGRVRTSLILVCHYFDAVLFKFAAQQCCTLTRDCAAIRQFSFRTLH